MKTYLDQQKMHYHAHNYDDKSPEVCQEMFEPFSEICDNFSTTYYEDVIQMLSENS